MRAVIVFFLLAYPWLACEARCADAWESFELENGVRVTLVHAPDAPRQHFFTFISGGLLGDGAGRTQFSHLVEHMLVRGTDPGSLVADGIEINGETTALATRLDTYCEPSKWREGLARHARWITTREFEQAVFEREKERIRGEEEGTVAGGFTHKWAEAAWAQVVRHGSERVALHGDVAGASLEELASYAEERVRVGAGLRFVAVGPTDPAELLAAVRRELGGLPPAAAGDPNVAADGDGVLRTGEREAEWDLAARHYIEWYPCPNRDDRDRVASQLVVHALNARIGQDAGLKAVGGNPMASLLVTPEGRWLAISLSLGSRVQRDDVQTAIRAAIDGCIASQPFGWVLMQANAQYAAMPDLSAMRAQWERSGLANDLIEGQLVLNVVQQEMAMGVRYADLSRVLSKLSANELQATAEEALARAGRSSLLLAPREE